MSSRNASSSPSSDDIDKRLKIRNSTPLPVSFILFSDILKFDPPETPTELYTCIYQTTDSVKGPRGKTTFVIKDAAPEGSDNSHLYIVTGAITSDSLHTGVQIEDFVNEEILLQVSNGIDYAQGNSTCIMKMDDKAAPSFNEDIDVDLVYKDILNPVPHGCVRIIVSSSFDATDERVPFVGIAMPKPHKGDSLPVIVWRAIPGTLTNVRPPGTWCVAQQEGRVSKIIDPGRYEKEKVKFRKTDFPGGVKNQEFVFTGSTFMVI